MEFGVTVTLTKFEEISSLKAEIWPTIQI